MKILFQLTLLLFSFAAFGQSNVQVKYLQKKNARINEEGGDFFSNDDFAVMVSNGTLTTYRYGQGGKGKEVKQGENNSVKIVYGDNHGYVFHRNKADESFVSRDLIKDQPFIVKEDYPEFDWDISLNNTREIGGYQCHRATTTFRGRNYEAWFTMKIPIDAGPWKLHGLPGLILEAKDEEGIIQFIFAGLEMVSDKDASWNKAPKNGINMSFKEFFEIRKQKDEEFIKKIASFPGVTVTPFNKQSYFEIKLD